MPATKSLQDLFINLLKDMYYAEKQILKALPNGHSAGPSSIISRRQKARSGALSRFSAFLA